MPLHSYKQALIFHYLRYLAPQQVLIRRTFANQFASFALKIKGDFILKRPKSKIYFKPKREIWAPSGLRSKKGNLSLKREKSPKGNLKVKREKWAKGNLTRASIISLQQHIQKLRNCASSS